MDETKTLDAALPRRFAWPAWLVLSCAFLSAYAFMWCVVHVHVDLRPCLVRLEDPLFRVIPYDKRWYYVSHDVYEAGTIGLVTLLAYRAWRGDHRALLRLGAGLTVQAVLRSTTIWLLPLCRVNVKPGSVALKQVPMLDLGLFQIPWRVWASNDLVFSGHVGEFFLLYRVTQSWPTWSRHALVGFQFLQAYALLATRGHYTVDLVIAVPCAYFADGMAMAVLRRFAARQELA